MLVKVCKKCGDENPHYILKTGKTYSWCKPCVNTYNLAQYHKHKPAHQARMVKRNRLVKYGLNAVEFEKLLEVQQGKCAICATFLAIPAVDHCHQTGTVRGLLCGKCNTGLGMFRDNTTLLKAAIEYLEAYRG